MFLYFFFNDTATSEIYTLSLHDALPICSAELKLKGRSNLNFAGSRKSPCRNLPIRASRPGKVENRFQPQQTRVRSEEHTSELQSRRDLVCRLLLEKKKKKKKQETLIMTD